MSFTSVGQDSEQMAQQLYTWVIDGGLEDQLVDGLSEMGPSDVEIIEIDNENLDIVLGCSYKAE